MAFKLCVRLNGPLTRVCKVVAIQSAAHVARGTPEARFQKHTEIQKEKMKMCKTIPMFILLLTGYLSNNMDVAAVTETITTLPEHSSLPPSKVTQAPANTATPLLHSVLPGLPVTHAPADTTSSSHSSSPASKVIQPPELETPPRGSDYDVPGMPLSAPVVATISIFCVILILVAIGVCYAWKKSRGSSNETNPVSSEELGLSLKRHSTRENQ